MPSFSQFLRLRRLCSDDADFNDKCEEMRQFFNKTGYPDSAVTTGKQGAREIHRETAPHTSQNEQANRIPFTFTCHSQDLAVKNVILKNFKILRNDPDTKHIFPLPPLISLKRNIGSFLVRSAFDISLTTNQEPSNANAYDAKLVPLFLTQSRSQDPVDPLKLLTTLLAPPLMSSNA